DERAERIERRRAAAAAADVGDDVRLRRLVGELWRQIRRIGRYGEHQPPWRIDFRQLRTPGLDRRGLTANDDDLGRMQQLLESGEQTRVRVRVVEQRRPRRPQRTLRRRQVARLAEQM